MSHEGVKMVEEIVISTLAFKGSKTTLKKVVLHKRMIGHKSVIIKEADGVKEVINLLTPEEQTSFCKEWNKNWRPEIDRNDIKKIVENFSYQKNSQFDPPSF